MGNTDSSMAESDHHHKRVPSSMRHKNRESPASLPKQPKPDHNEIERRFNQVLVTIAVINTLDSESYIGHVSRNFSIVYTKKILKSLEKCNFILAYVNNTTSPLVTKPVS